MQDLTVNNSCNISKNWKIEVCMSFQKTNSKMDLFHEGGIAERLIEVNNQKGKN